MLTSVEGLYAAGDITGVEEAPIAMEEGVLAGVSAAEAIGRMDAAEAESLRTAARERIAVLESGSFGESRKGRQAHADSGYVREGGQLI